MVWQHRPALDGLRTLAVYLVVCFHAGLAWADGGFVGVDLFFVLSGFLVASLLLEERYATGRIELWAFAARRVRRLLPAATLTMLATACVFLLVAPVAKRLDWIGDGQSALLYAANWHFLGGATDYFGADIEKSPYLHYWSLSVEEQFYIAFPGVLLGLVALKKWWRPALVVGLTAMIVVSIGAQLWWAQHDPLHAYYGTDSRIYQPLVGVLAAIAWRHLALRRSALRRAGWPLLLALLAVATSVTDLSESTRGLLATALSAGLILAVMTQTTPSLNRVLSLEPVVWLGKISYGVYLWHWPVLLLVQAGLDTEPWVVAVLTAVLATGLAALSWQLLEQPIRLSPMLTRHHGATILVGLTSSAVAALLLLPAILQSEVRPALVRSAPAVVVPSQSPEAAAVARDDIASPTDPVPPIDWAAIQASRGVPTTYCTLSDTTRCIAHTGTSGLNVMLVGDSHGRVLAPTIEKIAEERNFTLSYNLVPSCPWQKDVLSRYASSDERSDCLAARWALYNGLLDAMDIDVVILTELPRSSGTWEDNLLSTTGSTKDVDQLNLSTITESLETIKAAGAKSIVVDSWIVNPDGRDPFVCLSGARTVGECAVTAPPTPRTDSYWHTIATRSAVVDTITVNDLVCPTFPTCQAVLGGIPVWRDDKHYSTEVLLSQVDAIRDRLVATGFLG